MREPVAYPIRHFLQPTNHSCSQASLAMLLSYYDVEISPEEIMKRVPVAKNEQGEDIGTTAQQLATCCIELGFEVTMYSFDFQILDVSWSKFNGAQILEILEKVLDVRNVPGLGKEMSKIYVQSYIDFLKAGGKLHVVPMVSSKLLYELLKDRPLFFNVAAAPLFQHGRVRNVGLRKDVSDDINGSTGNHSMVMFGCTEDGLFLAADPWKKDNFIAIEPEEMIAVMTAAQIECDNFLFYLTKKVNS